MNTLSQVKGMRDLYPAEFGVVRRLRDTWTAIGRAWGYDEYEAPILESVDLYLSKTSEELVNKQSFRINDRKGRTLMMRPELTPSLARMIAKREQELVYPLRWQSFGQFFRYEKPQKGRTRAFYQWNIDLIGSDSMLADVETLLIARQCLADIGLSSGDVAIKINNRRILAEVLTKRLFVDAGAVPAVLTVLDRIDKVEPSRTVDALKECGVDTGAAGKIIEYIGGGDWESDPWFRQMQTFLETAGVIDWFEVDFRIIRGLDYYTGLVFEAWATGNLSRALFGGGRYDDLTRQVGGSRPLPGVGFAAGDVAITALLEDLNLIDQPGANARADVLVTVFEPELAAGSLAAASQLRQAGFRVQLFPETGKKLGKQLDYARKAGIRFVVIQGPDELKGGCITAKDLISGNQTTDKLDRIAEMLRSKTI